MKKKALQLASVASMIDQFNIPNIKILQSLGYSVDVAADFTDPGTITHDRAADLKNRLDEMNVRVFDIAIPRSPNPGSVSAAYKKVKELLNKEHYDLIHCHSPIGGVICRQAAKKERKRGTTVIYTAHGFHFYKGAPLKNWAVFYPIEKHFSRYTDVLITINKEDYMRGLQCFHAKRTEYVPGVGIDIEKFAPKQSERDRIRKELGLAGSDIMLLSVGELNKNKNHSAVIQAIKGLKITYVVVGRGEKREELIRLAEENSVDLRLTGFRTDVDGFYNAADLYVLPSIREGLNVSLMEAMASGLPVACGNIRGNTDLVDDLGGVFFEPNNVDSIRDAINKLLADMNEKGRYNQIKIESFSIQAVNKKMESIYSSLKHGKTYRSRV